MFLGFVLTNCRIAYAAAGDLTGARICKEIPVAPPPATSESRWAVFERGRGDTRNENMFVNSFVGTLER